LVFLPPSRGRVELLGVFVGALSVRRREDEGMIEDIDEVSRTVRRCQDFSSSTLPLRDMGLISIAILFGGGFILVILVAIVRSGALSRRSKRRAHEGSSRRRAGVGVDAYSPIRLVCCLVETARGRAREDLLHVAHTERELKEQRLGP
jgi:hypothetical protein